MSDKQPDRPPRDGLIRAAARGLELRDDTDTDDGRILFGHFARFDTWTEIDSFFEGRFMERIAPGAFAKTLKERQPKVLFEHGQDPQMGNRPLGEIIEVSEDEEGMYYEVRLLPGIPEMITEGIRSGLYGASFRFRVMREEWVDAPKKSRDNPDQLPERTLKEVQLHEFGPVTFGAYPEATSGLRSLTDRFHFERLARDESALKKLIEFRAGGAAPSGHPADAEDAADGREADTPAEDRSTATPTDSAEAEPHPAPGRSEPRHQAQDTQSESGDTMKRTQQELEARQVEIQARLQEIDADHEGRSLPAGAREEWDALRAEQDANRKLIAELAERRAALDAAADNTSARESGASFHTNRSGVARGGDIYDLSTIRMSADSPESAARELRDRALRAVEKVVIPDETRDEDAARAHIERLIERRDTPDGALSRHILKTGNPIYERAFGKSLMGGQLTSDEQRALAITSPGTAGLAVPFALDPTVLASTDGAVNPLRQIARVETIVQGNTWQGISSAGLTSTYGYASEAAEAGDNSPALVQPEVKVEKAQAFVPMSIEVSQDWTGVMGELARMFADAKDDVEAEKFITGTGTNEPEGILTGLTASELVDSVADETLGVGDLYAVEEDLGPRFRSRASWVAARNTYNLIRAFADADGPEVYRDRLPQGLGQGRMQADLLGYPAYESSSMPSLPDTYTDDVQLMVFGDFRHYLIVDKVGMTVEVIPHLFATANNRPSGQRGVYAYWRNGAGVLVSNAFRVLNVTENS